MIAILMMSAKLATPGLLKIKAFWNKVYDVIISLHETTNKISSLDSNYIHFLWFVSFLSMREVMTSIL